MRSYEEEMSMLSVVIPAYNEEQMLPRTVQVLGGILSANHIAYELVFVDDGSRDGTWNRICEAHQQNENVRGVHFSEKRQRSSRVCPKRAATVPR